MKKSIFQTITCLAVIITLSGCSDWFSITPQSEMVAEDFWKDKTDVASAVSSCYRGMCEGNFVRRLIVWGEVRSDNVIYGQSNETDLTYVLNASISPSNSYTQWGDFYTVINNCNTVLAKAPSVRDNDPNFSQAELNQYLAEVKAIRAFCYFTLVRTFNEIPYISEPYLDDTREYKVAQSSADSILNVLIEDLKSVEGDVAKEYAVNTAYNKGRVTQKAIWALIADMCLWRQDYNQCITYCDKIINTNAYNPLTLVPASQYFSKVFFDGNSDESIWELQFDYNTNNGAVTSMYGGTNTNPLLCASSLSDLRGSSFFREKDYRRCNAFVLNNGSYMIKKYVANHTSNDLTTIKASDFVWGNSTSNWIFYRLADAYLMKAEALVERNTGNDITDAVALVSQIYDRSNPDLDPGSLISSYNQAMARDLVFDERQREFLFEGKRYFDIVRRIRREGSPTDIVSNYLLAKYVSMSLDQTTVFSKLNDPDAIYFPINQDELKLNTLLHQNRFYETSSDIVKN